MKPPAKATKKLTVLEFPLNADTAQEAIALIVDTLDERCVLEFFDFFHPNLVEPGASVSVLRGEDGLQCRLGSHGWSSGWKPITRDSLIDYIYKNREHNEGHFFLKARYKETRETGTSLTSYYFDIRDKKVELGPMLLKRSRR